MRSKDEQHERQEGYLEEGEAFAQLAGLDGPRVSEDAPYDVIVIGAGQAGLALGYHLARRGLRFVILDGADRVGDVWRNRWDSLRLFTPATLDGLPGMPFPAAPWSFPTKDQMADYLEAYAERFELPVRTGKRVTRLARRGGGYVVVTADGDELQAAQAVVAMASYQKAKVPAFAADLRDDVVQLHSSAYRRPDQLREGDVLVVGAGNSGAEIAADLAERHHVWMSGRKVGEIPWRTDGVFGRLLLTRLLLRVVFHRLLTVRTWIGRKVYPKLTNGSGPLIRTKERHLTAAGVERVGRTVGVSMGLPELDDGRVLDVANVVWCTGYHPGFSWIDVPVIEGDGKPRHVAGVVGDAPGLYFVGLHYLYSVSSGMVHGVGRDADRIAGLVAERAEGARGAAGGGARSDARRERARGARRRAGDATDGVHAHAQSRSAAGATLEDLMHRMSFLLSIALLCAIGCGEPSMTADTGVPAGDAGGDVDDGGLDTMDGGSADGGPGGGDAGEPMTGWRAMELPEGPGPEDRVTGIHCTSTDSCVIATDNAISSPGGFLFAADDTRVGAQIMAGEDLTDTAGIVGTIGFLGIDETLGGLVARADVTAIYVSAAAAFDDPASWSAVQIGRDADGPMNGLNQQEAFQRDAAGRWLLATRQGVVFEASEAPSPTTFWTGLWSPLRSPPFPADFDDRLSADPTICEEHVGTRISPNATQNVFISQDLALAVYPAGGINQGGSAEPGVCISTDGGRNFHNVPFDGLDGERGPLAVTCIDGDTCFAYSGLDFDVGSGYVYRTQNASAGLSSTWARVAIPAEIAAASRPHLRHVFFAPDGVHGWIAGSLDGAPMLLRTVDGGASWTDASGPIEALTDRRLHSGFALDADHIWVGGERLLMHTDRAQD